MRQALLKELSRMLDRQQQLEPARALIASYIGCRWAMKKVDRRARAALLRENRTFHTIECVEADVHQHALLGAAAEAGLPLIAAAGYLAAHSTTTRSQRQAFEIALRVHRSEKLYDEGIT